MVYGRRLSAEKIFKKCAPDMFTFSTTEELIPLEGIVGQKRAVQAIDFGLKIKGHGYNIFMMGITGTGKTSYARAVAEEIACCDPVPDDWCYLYNFKNPDEPLALNLPAGMGSVFARDIHNLLEELKEAIPKALNTEEYERQKGVIVKKFQEVRNALMDNLNNVAQENSFMLKRTSTGFLSIPLKDGKELSEEEFDQLEKQERDITF